MSKNSIRQCRILIAIVGCALAVGCDRPKPTGKLQGRVTFEGDPVTEAQIQIQSQVTGVAAAAALDGDGNFKFDTPITVGEYAVSITPVFDIPPAGTVSGPITAPERPDVPARYRNAATSGFVVEVTEGETKFEADMTSE